MFKNFILAGLGGCIGSVLRYGGYLLFKPYPLFSITLCINILGSFLIGCIMALSIKNPDFGSTWKIFLATGICGGFTTFSAFSFENLQLIQEGRYMTALTYIALSLMAGIGCCFLGYLLVK